MFTITGLLIFTILTLIYVFVSAYIGEKGAPLEKFGYFGFMLILSIFSYFTIQNYIYPDEEIFTNDEYHVLEHMGFEAYKELYLVESEYQAISIWDNFTGSIKINRDSSQFHLSLKNFFKPFYYNQRGQDSDKYVLANNYIPNDFSHGLGIIADRDTLMELKIEYDEEEKKVNYLIKYDKFNTPSNFDTCNFHKTLYKGYPLLDLLLKAPNADKITPKLRDIIINSYLVRDSIKVNRIAKGNGIYTLLNNKSREKLSDLRYFPSGFVLNQPNITLYSLGKNSTTVNSSELDLSETFNISLSDRSLIYAGLGFDKTEEYILELDEEEESKFMLKYILPQMYKLKKDTSIVKLFMTSSNEEVIRNELDGGYFFNVFDNVDNNNHINTTLSYVTGDSRSAMHFKIKDLNKFEDESDIFEANEAIRVHTKNDKLKWLLKFNDLRESNALQAQHIYWLLFFYLALLYLRLIINTKAAELSPIEAGIHIVFFTFLVIRMILSWRASTFVPIEDISAAMFYTLRDIYSFYRDLFVFVGLFWLTLIARIGLPWLWEIFRWKNLKTNINIYATSIQKKLIKSIGLTWIYIILASLYLASGFVAYSAISPRFAFILWPTLFYFFADYIICRKYKNDPSKLRAAFFDFKSWPLARVILWSLVLVFLLIADSGFGVVFLLFSLIYYSIGHLLFEFRKLNEYGNQGKTQWIYLVLVYLIPLAAITFIFYHQNFFIRKIFTDTFYYLLAIALLFVPLVIFFVYQMSGKRRWISYCFGAISIGLSLWMLFSTSVIQKTINDKYKYIKYRAEVQNNDVDDLIIENNFNSSDITYILRSAQNQWFINIYQNAEKDNYFNIQPHFGQGSTYTTQTTDLVLLRYLIAEHPTKIVFLLLFLFILLVSIYVKSEDTTSLIGRNGLGVLILLFTIALFIWLTTTNRVIFFGQDYPFLSITSRLAFVLPTLLFLYVITMSSFNKDRTFSSYNLNTPNSYNWIIPCFLGGIMLAGVLMLSKKGENNDKNTFSMVGTELNKKIDLHTNSINQEFKDYQLRNLADNETLSIDSILNKYHTSADKDSKIKKLMNDTVVKSNFFYKSLLKRLMLTTTNKWDPTEVIHIRKRGKIFNLVNNNRYYSIKSPFEESDSWTGNLLAAPITKNSGFIESKTKEIFKPDSEESRIIPNILATVDSERENKHIRNYKNKMNSIYMMRIPEEWVQDSVPIFIMYNRYGSADQSQAKFNIYNDKIKLENDETSLVTKIIPEDIISFYYKDEKTKQLKKSFQWKYFVESNKYLAKNIWLNGERKFFYPIGKKFNWSYSYTQALREVLKEEDFINSSHATSIDYELTSDVFDIIHKENFPDHLVTEDTRSVLTLFRNLNANEQSNTNNNAQIYFSENKLNIPEDSRNLKNKNLLDILSKINDSFADSKSKNAEPENNTQILNQIIDRYIKSKFDYSAVALDGNGRIRLLFDYNKLVKVDPNNLEEYNNYIHRLYRVSSNATERDFFGNKSLLSMRPGAGSSLKPIVYSSVVSQFNLHWQNINIVPTITQRQYESITVDEERGDNPARKLAWYGGKSLENNRSLWNIDKHNFTDAGLRNKNYLLKSNNLYHSLVVFMGSYSKKQVSTILDPNKSILLNRLNERFDYEKSFPILNINEMRFSINEDNWPSESQGETNFFSKSTSLIAIGLNDNFKWNTERKSLASKISFEPLDVKDKYKMIYDSSKVKSNYYYWCYPEHSSFFQIDRKAPPNLRNGLIQPTLGAFPMQITPLKMAEMTMRMVSFNSNENITTLNPATDRIEDHQFFRFDEESWGDTTTYINWVQDNIFEQMNMVFKRDPAGGRSGTMYFLDDNLEKYRKDGYYFYGKTGTISDESDVFDRGKHLMVIITKEKLHDSRSNPLTTDRLKNLKYYVLFLSYHDIRTKSNEERTKDYDPENYFKVIDAVMKSELFEKYMTE